MPRNHGKKKEAVLAPALPKKIILEFSEAELKELITYLEAVQVKGTKAETVQIVNRIAYFQNRFMDATKT